LPRRKEVELETLFFKAKEGRVVYDCVTSIYYSASDQIFKIKSKKVHGALKDLLYGACQTKKLSEGQFVYHRTNCLRHH